MRARCEYEDDFKLQGDMVVGRQFARRQVSKQVTLPPMLVPWALPLKLFQFPPPPISSTPQIITQIDAMNASSLNITTSTPPTTTIQ